jgi:Uma2 family endonuclease
MPLHQRSMTLAEWDALPEDNSAQYELVAGALVVSPKALRRHQLAMALLASQMDEQLPAGWEVGPDFEVLVQAEEPATVRAPDVVVVRADAPQQRALARDVALAAEILSPRTRKVDLQVKAIEYAEAGIPHYWIVDLDPPVPTITVFGLGALGDGYVESQTAAHELVVDVPFPLRIDVDALVGRRAH